MNKTLIRSEASQLPPGANSGQFAYITTSDADLREGPGTTYRILRPIPKGTKIVVVGREGLWLKVQSVRGNPSGYVHEQYARPFYVQTPPHFAQQSPAQPGSFQPKPEVMYQRPRFSGQQPAPAQQPTPAQDQFGGRNSPGDLINACGSKGLAVDFVTGNCVAPRGQQVNPQNLYPPFTAPLPKPQPNDLIMRCGAQGRSADFVTGRCM